jgi:RimJ/RimL family protein N-acetyltransferase
VRNVPVLELITAATGLEVRVFGHIMRDAKSNMRKWAVPKSPPEVEEFNVPKIPLIVILKKDGEKAGEIVENPPPGKTVEQALLDIMKKSKFLTQVVYTPNRYTMREGTIYRSFVARDGRTVTLRAPKWSDLDDYLHFINSLVEEKAMIMMNEKQTRDSEIAWIGQLLGSVERDKMVAVVAEVDGRLVGSCEITPKKGYLSHLGSLGISLLAGYRELGIGQEMMLVAEKQAKGLSVEVVDLEVFEANTRAIHVYEKIGYKITGRIPDAVKYKGEYMDALIMTKGIT